MIKLMELQNGDYTIRGVYTIPKNIKTHAVLLHGYTGNKCENGQFFKQIAKMLEEEGIASLRFDYYGSGDSDGFFDEQNFDTVVSDAKCVINKALELNQNAPILLFGFSMGGACASFVSMDYLDKIEKLILLSPASNMKEILNYTFSKNVDKNDLVDLGGYCVSKKFMESFEDKDLLRSCTSFKNPVLITQGSNDLSVPPAYSKKYHDLYANSNYTIIEGASHCYTKVEHRMKVIEVIRNFIK